MNNKMLIAKKIEEASMYGYRVKEVNGKYYLRNRCNCCDKIYTEEIGVEVDGDNVYMDLSTYCNKCDVNRPLYDTENEFDSELDFEDYTG